MYRLIENSVKGLRTVVRSSGDNDAPVYDAGDGDDAHDAVPADAEALAGDPGAGVAAKADAEVTAGAVAAEAVRAIPGDAAAPAAYPVPGWLPPPVTGYLQ